MNANGHKDQEISWIRMFSTYSQSLVIWPMLNQ